MGNKCKNVSTHTHMEMHDKSQKQRLYKSSEYDPLYSSTQPELF